MLKRGLCITERIWTDDEVLLRVERPAWSDEMIELMMVRTEAMLDQDRVVLGDVQRAVRDIGHLQLMNDAATLSLEIPEVCNLMRRLVRPVCKNA